MEERGGRWKGEEARSPIKNTPITPAVTHLTPPQPPPRHHRHAHKQAHTAAPPQFLQLSLPFSHKPTFTESRQTKSEWFLTPRSITEVYLSQPPDKPHRERLSPSAAPRLLSLSSRCDYGYYKLVILKQHRPKKNPRPPMTQATLMTQHSKGHGHYCESP